MTSKVSGNSAANGFFPDNMVALTRYIEVPKGMSYINAFEALKREAKVQTAINATVFQDGRSAVAVHEASISTAEKVEELFNNPNRYPKYFIGFAGGREINVFFNKFPKLNVILYDKENGEGAALKALEEYAKVLPEERFDAGDAHQFPPPVRKERELPSWAYQPNSSQENKKWS